MVKMVNFILRAFYHSKKNVVHPHNSESCSYEEEEEMPLCTITEYSAGYTLKWQGILLLNAGSVQINT